MSTPLAIEPDHPPQILICGYYGFGNAGDEAILSVLLDDLRRVHASPSVTVVTGHPLQVQADHGVDAIDALDLEHVMRTAAAADLMVLGGGGLFQDYSGVGPDTLLLPSQWGLTYYAGFAILGGLVGTPVAIYGVGVGPLTTSDGRRFTATAFEQASFATVRDHASKALLAELGVAPDRVSVTADPAFLLKPGATLAAVPPGNPASPTIGVSVRPWGDGTWIEPMAHALDEIVEKYDATILFVPFQRSDRAHEDDTATSRSVAELMIARHRIRFLEAAATPAETLAAMGSCGLVIGMRLHSMIFAAAAGTPMVGIAYDPKVSSVMAELGLSDYTLALDSVGDLPAMTSRAMTDRTLIREELDRTVPLLRERACRNAGFLRPERPTTRTQVGSIVAGLLINRVSLWRRPETLSATLQRTEAELRRLSAEHEALLHSKAMAPARLYWKLRDALSGNEDS